MAEILVRATGLCKSFGKTRAVDGVSLQVAAGEIYGLVGPDGAGKTTLLRLLCGALRPTAGEAWLGAFDLAHHSEQAREQIGYLAQRFSLYEDLTVLENLRFFAEVRGLKAADWQPRSREVLEFVGLAPFSGRQAGQLSGGMKQKLGLALALVNRPRILLLDEPTTGVDPLTRQDFWRLMIRLMSAEDLAVLISTPYMDEAARCTRVGFLRAGRLVCEGTPRELRSRLAGRVVELAGEPQPLLASLAQAEPAVESIQHFGNLLHLQVKEGQAQSVIQRLEQRIAQSGGRLERLLPVEAQLEDVFIAFSEGLD